MKKIAFLGLTVLANSALAQSNLGELFDAGGVLLSKEALTQVISGTSWQTAPNPGEITYKPDGTFTGFARTNEGGRGIFGTWTIDDKGLFCIQSLARGSPPEPFCRYWFKLNDKYFASAQPTDRAAPIGPRLPSR